MQGGPLVQAVRLGDPEARRPQGAPHLRRETGQGLPVGRGEGRGIGPGARVLGDGEGIEAVEPVARQAVAGQEARRRTRDRVDLQVGEHQGLALEVEAGHERDGLLHLGQQA